MAEYMPTTEDVVRTYMLARHAEDATLKQDPDNSDAIDEFDRWLAAHDREVAARVLREAAGHGLAAFIQSSGGAIWARGRHLVSVDWLNARADTIERGE